MLETFFRVDFGGTEYQGLYVRELATALDVIAKMHEKNCTFAVDVETEPLPQYILNKQAGLSPHLSKIRLFQIFDGKTSIVFDLKHIDNQEFLIPFLESKTFVAHNALFEWQFFNRIGVKKFDCGCTMLAAKLLFHALYPTDAGLSAGLGEISAKILKIPMRKELQVSNWSLPNLTYEQIEYASIDVIATMLLAKKMLAGLKTTDQLKIYKLYRDSIPVIGEIQLNGMRLNVPEHIKMVHKWKEELYAAKKKLLAMTGLPKITSATLAEYLEKILPPDIKAIWPRTEGAGRLSTDAHAFSDFNFLDIVKPFSEYQKKDKLTSSFGAPLQEFINPQTGKIHGSFHLCGTRSGRLSCSKPNIQQSPRDPEFRRLFIPDEGKVFICADYGAIEVRAAAEISRDSNMVKAFRSGTDIYRATAALMNRKKIEEVTKEERQRCKCLVLGLQFGLGAKKLGHYAKKGYGVEFTEDEAYEQVSAYRDLYSEFREWQLNQVDFVANNNFVVTAPWGKKRKLEPGNAFGTALNHPIQSSCASMMLLALIRFREQANKELELVATIHDEIIIQVPEDTVEEGKIILNAAMREAYREVFPNALVLTDNLVDIHEGKSWGEAKA